VANYTKEELRDKLAGFATLLRSYQDRLYRAMFPSDAREQAEVYRRLAKELLDKAANLEADTLSDIACQTEIERDVFRLSYIIERTKGASRKGPVTRKQLAAIKRIAARKANKWQGT
jgi:hypothetical protein